MTESMINKLARVAYDTAERLNLSLDTAEGGGDLSGATLIVRAVLQAMREPGDDVLRAGWEGLPPPRPYDLAAYHKGFAAAIDYILNESGSPADPT